MNEYVTTGAIMTCTNGAAPVQLLVTANTLFSVQGNMVATTSDKAPINNIPSFGACAAKNGSSCVPSTMTWTGFLASVQIPGGNPLLKTSMIMCSCGGCIKFQNSGQIKPNKLVTIPNSLQIETLKRAAQNATPFCEECEKKKQEKKKEITRIFWVDEEGDQRTLSELPCGKEITLCVETKGVSEGEIINIELNDKDGRIYKGEKETLKFSATVESDNTAYIDAVKLEYE
ncbi:DUF4280 domain-containing protein [Prevotella sp. 10(H)]|uniref:DUF4280 domain-containing protein n=1 Tax=Prevotella sp. 10(H) TaxID=1158294 RepID=UPI0009DE90DF|nr:DUF4280 domain-containing protein [Prevotella sp. 10(H)]